MDFLPALGSAIWLGILTSISPCPLAANIAAISFISKRVDNPGRAVLTGMAYTAGRTLTYLILAIILVASLLKVTDISLLLQKYMNQIVGPVLIVAGMFLLELISFNTSGRETSAKLRQRVEAGGIWSSFLLGMFFALSFCPVSAALFFGSLIPIAVAAQSAVVLPVTYGIGTALPVLLFALLIAFGAKKVGQAFNILTRVEFWARRVTGIVFILVGIYYCLSYIFHII